MTAEQSPPEEESSVPSVPSPGTQLRQARESARMSLEDVAAETRMTLPKVRALEADDYDSLHSDTFVRGYLRTYAKVLKLDPEDLLRAYRQERINAGLEEEPEESPLQITVTQPGRPLWHFAVWILLTLVGLLVLSIWFFDNKPEFLSSQPSLSSPETSVASSPPDEEGGAAPTREVLESNAMAAAEAEPRAVEPEAVPEPGTTPGREPAPESETVPEPAMDVPEADSTQEAVPEVTRMAETAGPEVGELDQLQLNFTDECWLVVTDARGDVLHTDLVQPGQNLSLLGVAPFDVKMGNAPAVQMSLNGEPVDLEIPAGRRLLTVAVGE